MKKNKITLILMSFALAFVGLSFNIKQNVAVSKVEAASHPDNYNAYIYNGNYYSSITSSLTEGLEGTLRQALTTLIHPTSVPSYSGGGDGHLSEVLQSADEDPDNSSNMIYLYTRDSVKKNAASTWNREHVWPQSLSNNCWGQGRAGSDLLHIRPTYNTTNSTRSNDKYGNVTGGTTRIYNNIIYGYSGSGNIFMPLDSVKGDVARICMYVWVSYHDEYGSKLPSLTNVFESFDTLMSWHIADRPDVMEGNRNNYAQNVSMQGNRNPFVDHPEYAWKIFGSQCSTSVYNDAKAAYPEGEVIGITSISRSSVNLLVDETTTINATSSNSSTITWSTSNSDVATISTDSSSSGSNITITAVGEGTATITATCTISGKDYFATCTINVTTSGGGGGGGGGGDTPVGDSYTISYTDLADGSYPTTPTSYTAASGISFTAYNCANYSSKIQFKKNGGYLYNNNSLNLSSLTISNLGGSGSLTVYAGTSKEPSSTVISGSSGVYNLTGYNYFKIIDSSSNAVTCSSIIITLLSSETTLSYITVATDPTKLTYTAGQYFDPTGLIINRFYSDNTDDTYSYSNHTDEFSFYPSLSTPLDTSDESVEISYGGQTCYLGISVNAIPVTLSSISVSGMTTHYYVDDAFSFDGTCTATYSNDYQTEVTPTSVTSPNMSVAGVKTITVSYTEDEITRTDTYNIYVEDPIIPLEYSLTNNSPYINGIAYKMYMINTKKSSTNYFSGEMSTYYGKTITNGSSSAVSKIYFEESGNGQNMYFYIDNDETTDPQYLFVVKSGTHYNFSYSETEPQTKWIYQSTETYKCITYTLDNIPFTFGNRDNYTNLDTVNLLQQTTDYKVDFVTFSGEGSKSFPLMMNSYITCDASGETAPTYSGYSWSLFALAYSKFCDVDKGDFVNADPDSSGSEIEQFVARYDYIVGKYKYTDFLNRSPALINYSRSYVLDITNGHTTVIVIVVSSLVALTFLGIVVMKKKRRFHQ